MIDCISNASKASKIFLKRKDDLIAITCYNISIRLFKYFLYFYNFFFLFIHRDFDN